MANLLLNKILSHSTMQGTDIDTLSFFNKYNQLHLEESDELMRRKFRKILSQEYELERMGLFAKEMHILEAQNQVLLKQKKAIKKHNSHLFITINPKPAVPLQQFMVIVHKIAKKTCFENILYVFEQRGTIANCDIGKGFHCHMLVQRNLNYKPTKCITNVQNSLTKIVKSVKDRHLLNIKVIGPEFALDKKDYILGTNKEGEEKELKQQADIKWRETESIYAFYGDKEII